MRESIKVKLSPRFANEVVKKEIAHDFDVAFSDMITLNLAYAVELVRAKLLDKASAKEIIDGFLYVKENMTRDDVQGELEDLYFNVERKMFEKVGPKTGGKLHVGRSRNDIAAVLNRMVARRSVLHILDLLLELKELLLKKSEEHIDTVITGYTHFQPGQPITLGHYYTAINSALCRDFERIVNAYAHTNLSPYGAAAFAGTSFPIDRQELCDLLGFDKIIENTQDCIGARDYYMELAAAYSIMATNISRAAEDMYFWSTFENGILEIGGEVAVCSSIMPQKRNPVSLEMARAKAGHVIAGLSGITTILKGISFSNSMDLFELPVEYWNMVDQVEQMLICMIETISHCSVRKERAASQAADNLCTVTSLADYMVNKFGISFTAAHDIVGNIVAISIEDGTLIKAFTPKRIMEESEKLLGQPLVLTEDEIADVLDPSKNVETKKNIGGPSHARVLDMISRGNELLASEKDTVTSLRDKIENSIRLLENEYTSIK